MLASVASASTSTLPPCERRTELVPVTSFQTGSMRRKQLASSTTSERNVNVSPGRISLRNGRTSRRAGGPGVAQALVAGGLVVTAAGVGVGGLVAGCALGVTGTLAGTRGTSPSR